MARISPIIVSEEFQFTKRQVRAVRRGVHDARRCLVIIMAGTNERNDSLTCCTGTVI